MILMCAGMGVRSVRCAILAVGSLPALRRLVAGMREKDRADVTGDECEGCHGVVRISLLAWSTPITRVSFPGRASFFEKLSPIIWE